MKDNYIKYFSYFSGVILTPHLMRGKYPIPNILRSPCLLRMKAIYAGVWTTTLLLCLICDTGTHAHAFYEPAAFGRFGEYRNRGSASTEDTIGNEELDKMRGGFVTNNGMVIDFAFSANTLIDGQLINQVVLNTVDIAANSGSLRNVIQTGHGNKAFDSAMDINVLPNVLTVVQNNLDNLTIQQLNLLDLSVKNMGNFTIQSFASEMNFQNSIGMAP
jgi:hypothetical protein